MGLLWWEFSFRDLTFYCWAFYTISAAFPFKIVVAFSFSDTKKFTLKRIFRKKISELCTSICSLFLLTHTTAVWSDNFYRNDCLTMHSSLIKEKISHCFGHNIDENPAPPSTGSATAHAVHLVEERGKTLGDSAPSYHFLWRPVSAQDLQPLLFWRMPMSLFLQLTDSPLWRVQFCLHFCQLKSK